ncbi:MAG: adenylyl-sulfate kinase [Minisyncoccia bacterium]|jgi:adenylyl-sulfate kinase
MSTVLWFTGLSGAGKTTIAEILKARLEERGKSANILDGDVVRELLHTHLGFTPEDIKENNRLIAELAKERMNHFDFVLVPIISPFEESRKLARETIGSAFKEVYINASKELVIKRDTKGLYKKAKEGRITNLIGYHAEVPYEAPEYPDIEVRTGELSIGEAVDAIEKKLAL